MPIIDTSTRVTPRRTGGGPLQSRSTGVLREVIELPRLGARQEGRELRSAGLDDHVGVIALTYEDVVALRRELKAVALRVRRKRGLLPLYFH